MRSHALTRTSVRESSSTIDMPITKILSDEITYTGKELRPGWIAQRAGIDGDAAVGFIGPCRVDNEDLVDLEDQRAGTFIAAASMVHVIAERPGVGLAEAVLQQRLLVCLLCEMLGHHGCRVRRDGDDLYVDERKLTVSIAAPAASSCLIHLGVNVRPDGAPVPAIGLEELDIDPHELLRELLERYRTEMSSCHHAVGKVRTVG